MSAKSVGTSRRAGEPTTAFRLKKILVPTDFSEASTKALTYAQAFAKQSAAEILLLHVVEPAYYPIYGADIVPDWGGMQTELLKASQVHLEEFSRKHAAGFAPMQVIVGEGIAWGEIVETAKKETVDLIILSTHGRSGLRHILLGSTTERVVRHASCPVLTVREREREFVNQD